MLSKNARDSDGMIWRKRCQPNTNLKVVTYVNVVPIDGQDTLVSSDRDLALDNVFLILLSVLSTQ